MTFMVLSEYIFKKKKELGLSLLDLSLKAGIDPALVSKYTSGKRIPSENHVALLAKALEVSAPEIRKYYLAEKVAKLVKYEKNAIEILKVAETRMEYLRSDQSLPFLRIEENVIKALKEIDALKNAWQKKLPLDQMQGKKLQEHIHLNYTYNSNRIEGNTLSLQETYLVVNKGLTIGGKSMQEHLEAINHMEAIDFIHDLVKGKEEIKKKSLLDIHSLVLKSIDSAHAGCFRKVGVRISGSKHIPPEPLLVPELMEDYFQFYEEQKRMMHPIILAAEMHERLVSIHPFLDGNGRTARLVMNFILLKHGYPITILKGDLVDRIEYYKALESVQMDNNPTPFYLLILARLEASLKEHIELA